MSLHHRRIEAALLAGFLVVSLSACAEEAAAPDEAGASPPTTNFVAADYSFEGPATLPAGVTEFRLENTGTEIHQIQLVRLDEGKTAEDLQTFMTENPGHMSPDFATFEGGPNAAMPGDTVNAFVDLQPGQYVLLCAIPSPDGVPHAEKGMVTSLTVEESDAAVAAAPDADLEIAATDFAFVLPEEMTAGEQVIEFENDGEQAHEIVLVKLDEGATAAEIAAAFSPDAPPGPPPGATVGGTVGIEPGTSQSFTANLEPGDYGLLCFLTDPESGAPHVALGMMTDFTIQ